MGNEAPGEGGERGFRVTDRRRVGPEGPRESPTSAEPSASTPTDAAEKHEGDEPFPPDLPFLSVPDLLRVFISELSARALVHLGLAADPGTNLLTKDLPQARLAIDCIGSLMEHFGPLAQEGEREEFERMLADLRIHFVREAGA